MSGMTLGSVCKFLSVGMVNTAVGLGVIYGAKWFGGWHDGAANFAGYSVGLVTSFVLNRNWTFRHSGSWGGAALRFLLTFAVAYVVNLGIVLVLVDVFGWNGYLAQLFGIPPYTFLFYLGSRYFAFPAIGGWTSQGRAAGVRVGDGNANLTRSRA